MKSQIFHIIFLTLTIIFSSCQENDDIASNKLSSETIYLNQEDIDSNKFEFTYNNEKYYLIPDSSKFFVVYGNTIDTNNLEEVETRCANSIITNSNKFYNWEIVESNPATTRNFDRESNRNIIYCTPFYISEKSGNTVGVSNLIHVKLKKQNDLPLLNDYIEQNNLSIFSHNEYLPLWYTISCNDDQDGNALQICKKLQEKGLFSVVEPDFMCELYASTSSFSTPNDPYYSQQWYLNGTNSIKWPEASAITNGKNISIGIIDSGVECTHPDLIKSNVSHAFDAYLNQWFVNRLYSSHGTSCAGIIAATINNNVGIAGIASGVSLNSYSDPLIARPNASHNLAQDLSIALRSHDVVSCSWGSNDLFSSEITDAINFYMPEGRKGKGTILVFASGNNNSSVIFPANSHPDIIVVGSSGRTGNRSTFSNYGDELDIMAPGESIYTLGFNGESTYGYDSDFTGTSAACPQIAAISALILSINPNLSNIEVAEILEQTTQKTGSYTYKNYSTRKNGTWNENMGYGLVNATAAVKAAQNSIVH